MNIKIPGETKMLRQENDSSVLGSIVESFNLDLRSDKGKIKVTKAKKVGDFEGVTGFTSAIVHIGQNNGIPFFFGLRPAADAIYEGDGSTFYSSTFTRDTSSAVLDPGYSDVTTNNGYVYASFNDSVWYSSTTAFGIWTEIASPALDDSSPHLLCGLGNKTYVTNLDYKVGSINSSNVLSLTGTSTLDLGMPEYTITVFMAGLDRIWIGLSCMQQGNLGTTYIYEWDGESENTPSQKYEIDASGLICGVIKDGIPYVLDTNGRLLAYAGSRFVEVGRLPYKSGELMMGFKTNQFDGRAIHPRAITVDGDEILINVSNLLQGSTQTDKLFADFPSGVWAWNPDNGFYHKYSGANHSKSETGSTNLASYGEQVVAQAGHIYVHDPIVSFSTTGEGGRVLFTQRYFTGSDNDTQTSDTDVTYKTAIFGTDVNDASQKWGYFVTSELQTPSVTEAWKKIYVTYKDLLNSTDKIIVKYRTKKQDKTLADVAWVNTQTIQTSTDVSAYREGDEIQFIQGKGSGMSRHIKSIVAGGSSYTITLDDTFGDGSGTALAYFENWQKLGEITPLDEQQWKGFTLPESNVSPMVQFKVAMQFTGDDELYGLEVKSSTLIKE